MLLIIFLDIHDTHTLFYMYLDGDDPDHIMYKHVPVSVYVGHTGLVLKCEKTKKNRRRLEVTKIPDERLRRNCIKDGVENTIRFVTCGW